MTDLWRMQCTRSLYARSAASVNQHAVAVKGQAARGCRVLALSRMPSTYCAPAYTAGSNSAPLSLRKVDSATCKIFQINAVAFSTFLKRLAAVVRSRTVAKGDSTIFVVRKCTQCSRGN